MASSNSTTLKTPVLRTISVESGNDFLDDVTAHCINHYTDVVRTFVRGLLPLEVIEFATAGRAGEMLARRAGSYRLPNGSVSTVDQCAREYRAELLADIIANDATLAEVPPEARRERAILILFPESERVSREKFRANYSRQCTALLQLIMLLWPSSDVRVRMQQEDELIEAMDRNDLIRFVKAFNKFCLTSSGNKQINAERAEFTLENTRMSGLDLPKYVKAFKKAAFNVKSAGSLFDEYRIVSTFVRNLNHSADVFEGWYTDFLNKHKSTHVLSSQNLEFAIKYVEDHFTEVILPESERKKKASTTLASVKAVEQLLSSGGKGRGNNNNNKSLTMPYTVLATLLGKRPTATAPVTKVAKQKVEKAQEVKVEKPKSAAKVKKPCFKFASADGCTYGDKCRFSHTA
jgi:hypothetical protein